jgi:hypothetical protein
MTTSFSGESATIYEFPLRGRFAAAARGDETVRTMTPASLETVKVTGEAWYHEAAISDADKSRKN